MHNIIKNYINAHLPVLFLFFLTSMAFFFLPDEAQNTSSSPRLNIDADNIVINRIDNDVSITLAVDRFESGEEGEYLLHDIYFHLKENGNEISISGTKGIMRENFSALSFVSARGEIRVEDIVLPLLASTISYDIKQKTLHGKDVSVINEKYKLSADNMIFQQNEDLLLDGNVESTFNY